MFEHLSLPILSLVFAVAGVVVWVAGVYISKTTDVLSSRFGLGEALGGLILLAIVTNLPEIAITASGAMRNQLGLATGNILGGILAIPLTAGIAKGHVTLGIIAALITLPVAAMLGCCGGLPVAAGLAALINLIPKIERPLLSQSEIEAETRKIRGY